MPLTIYTGGAKGVDTHVEWLCHLYGHSCVVLIPPCHPRAKSLAPLTQPDLDAATPIVTQAAFRLGRQIHHPISLHYIQRICHVIQPASLVLAVGYFDEFRKHVLGGTGWSVVMAQLLGKPSMSLIWIWNNGLGGIPPPNNINPVRAWQRNNRSTHPPRQNHHCRHSWRRQGGLSHPGSFI